MQIYCPLTPITTPSSCRLSAATSTLGPSLSKDAPGGRTASSESSWGFLFIMCSPGGPEGESGLCEDRAHLSLERLKLKFVWILKSSTPLSAPIPPPSSFWHIVIAESSRSFFWMTTYQQLISCQACGKQSTHKWKHFTHTHTQTHTPREHIWCSRQKIWLRGSRM